MSGARKTPTPGTHYGLDGESDGTRVELSADDWGTVRWSARMAGIERLVPVAGFIRLIRVSRWHESGESHVVV